MSFRTQLARLILLLQLAYTSFVYAKLPAVTPNAYDASGTPHRFAPRAILWLLLLLNIGVQILLTVIARHPNTFNLPSNLSDPDRPRQTAIAINMLSWLQLEVALLLASLAWQLTHEDPHVRFANMLPAAIILLALLSTIVSGIYRMRTPPNAAVL